MATRTKDEYGEIDRDGNIGLSKFETETLLKDLDDTEKSARYNQLPIRWRWRFVRNYVLGFQEYDPSTGLFKSHRAAMWPNEDNNIDAESVIVNDMLKVHTINVQRLSAYDLSPDVIPDSNDPDDKKAARMTRTALADWIRKSKPAKTKRRIAAIIDKYGCVFLKVTFDPMAGNLVGKPYQKDSGEWAISENELQYEGEMVLDVVSPENIILPRFTTDLADIDWLQEINIKSIDYIYRKYGKTVDAEDINAEQFTLTAISDIGRNKSDNVYMRIGKEDKKALVKERWYNPSPRFPRGAHVIWVGGPSGTILRSTTLLDHYDEIPYFGANEVFDEKDAFGDSILWHLIPLQDLKNKSVSALYRHTEMMSQNKWLVHEDTAQVSEKDLNNDTGAIVKWAGDSEMQRPTQIQPPPIDPTVLEQAGLMDQYREVISSTNDISRKSKAPSGNAIAAMTDLENSVFTPTLEQIEEMFSLACRSAAKGMCRNYKTMRIAKDGGGAKPWVVEKFRGDMLRNNTHVTIKLMNGLPTEKLARLQFLLQLYQSSLLTADQVRPYIELGEVNEALKEARADQEAAEEIVSRLSARATAPLVKFHPWDNHPLIVALLVQSMREGYDYWEPWQQEIFGLHLHLHQQAAATLEQKSAAQFMGQQGSKAFTAPTGGPPPMTPDTNQNPMQQPMPGSVPPALAQGFQNIGAS